MNNLNGKTILVGKEPGQGRLRVAVQGLPKTGALGAVGSVPASVSRCKPEEGVAHCKIAVAADGIMTITNMKPQNVTYVDGMEVMSKRITTSSQVALGMERYPVSVATILQVAEKLLPPPPPPPPKEYSIRHLEAVWEDYDRAKMGMLIEQQRKANQQRLQGILQQIGMLAVLIPSVLPQVPIPSWLRVVFVVAGLGVAVYLWIRGNKPDELFAVKQKKLDEEMEKKYVCPNPECRHTLPFKKYSLLMQDKGCPYCKCRYKA